MWTLTRLPFGNCLMRTLWWSAIVIFKIQILYNINYTFAFTINLCSSLFSLEQTVIILSACFSIQNFYQSYPSPLHSIPITAVTFQGTSTQKAVDFCWYKLSLVTFFYSFYTGELLVYLQKLIWKKMWINITAIKTIHI